MRCDGGAVVEERSGEGEGAVLVDQAVGQGRPPALVPVVGVRPALQQDLRHLLGLVEPGLLQ